MFNSLQFVVEFCFHFANVTSDVDFIDRNKRNF
jgi:hypothetical protein